MGLIRYSDSSMQRSTLALLDKITPIIESYDERGYRLTVRQLYYQLVARLIISNTIASYQKVSKIVTLGRMQGMIDWNIIVDRVRVPMMPNEFYSMGSFVEAIKNSYRSYRWQDQDHYVEVMVEKGPWPAYSSPSPASTMSPCWSTRGTRLQAPCTRWP